MNKNLPGKVIGCVLIMGLAGTVLAGCGATGTDAGSAGNENDGGIRNITFNFNTKAEDVDEVVFNDITFEVPHEWRVTEEGGDAVYYPKDEDTDVIRVHAGTADQEYGSQQELVEAMFDEIMQERLDAGCYIQISNLKMAGHQGRWYRTDVNYFDSDGNPIEGFEQDESMNGYVQEGVIYAADKQRYVYLVATYPIGSDTDTVFETFYKSPHYHR